MIFLKFWFFDAPLSILKFFGSLNHTFFQLFSLPLFLRTFFKPIKNEYRQGLVGFSIAMGMVVKSAFIVADIFILILLMVFEITVFVGFIFFPIATIWILFL
jgi:hypothetical protein